MKTAPTHDGHHPATPGSVFPGQPPAHVLPPAAGLGTTQPVDIIDTAKGSPLPHWDGVLIGSITTTGDLGYADGPHPWTSTDGIYVNGQFNYGDFASTEQAVAAVKQLTAPADKPAAVIWKDKYGIVHAQALLQFGSGDAAPTALHLEGQPLPSADVNDMSWAWKEKPPAVFLGHPEALYLVDGHVVVASDVPSTVPVAANGGTGWTTGGGGS